MRLSAREEAPALDELVKLRDKYIYFFSVLLLMLRFDAVSHTTPGNKRPSPQAGGTSRLLKVITDIRAVCRDSH